MNRPTITVTIDASPAIAALSKLNERTGAIPFACSACGGLWAAADLEDGLCLPCTAEDDSECMECGDPWSDTELDDDGRCWACAARIRNEARDA